MRVKILLLIILVLVALTLIALSYLQTNEGPHGGRLKQSGNYYIELKLSESGVYAYLNDSDLKPVSNRGITCELKTVFPDHIEMKLFMQAIGDDGFYADLPTGELLEYKINFNVMGKPVVASFKNEKLIVQKQ